MRTTWAVALVLAIGVAATMFGASGYAAQTDADPTEGLGPVSDGVGDNADNSSVNTGVDGAASSTDQPLINFILNGGGAILSTAKLVATLPIALVNLGFPAWFAFPVGSVITITTGIGILQFISGRIYQ